MANNNNLKPKNILTADEWKLVSLLIELLEPFCIVTLHCSKNNALLSSVFPYAAVLKKFFNHKANSPSRLDQSSSTTLAENIEKAFEGRFYAINNSTRINLHDNNLFLLTKAVDTWHRLDYFPANLKQKVVRLMKSQVKNHSSRETGQSGQGSLVPPNKPKAQIPTNDVPKKIMLFYYTFKS